MKRAVVPWLFPLALAILTGFPSAAQEAGRTQVPPSSVRRVNPQVKPQDPATQTAQSAQRMRVVPPTAGEMPKLVGRSFDDAIRDRQVLKLGLVLLRREAVYSAAPGTIVRQGIAPGRQVKARTQVEVWVAVVRDPDSRSGGSGGGTSDGVPPEINSGTVFVPPDWQRPKKVEETPGLTMPNFVGSDVRTLPRHSLVRQRLLRVAPEGDERSDAEPHIVVRQSVAAGSQIERGREVRVWYATGVVVPRLVSLDARAVPDQLRDRGLHGVGERVPTRRARAGTVIGQDPAAGTLVRRGSRVVVRVAEWIEIPEPEPGLPQPPRPEPPQPEQSRPQPPETTPPETPRPEPPPPPEPKRLRMPDLVGLSVEQARGHREVVRGPIGVEPRDDPRSSGTPGTIVRQSVPPNTLVDPDSTVDVWVATGVKVPPVTRMPANRATETLEGAGLTARREDVPTDAAPARTVTQQDPAAGTRVARGSPVRLIVAVPEPVTVPDVRGQTRAQAEGSLGQRRLVARFADDEESEREPGTVSAQTPSPGTVVTPGAAVLVSVATGVTVPEVAGLDGAEARRRLERASLSSEEERAESQGEAGSVVSQDPQAGSRVARRSTVTLVIAVPETAVVPDVRRRARAEAERLLSARKLVAAFEDDARSDLAPGAVARQDPAPETRVTVGSRVRVALARGVTVPDVAALTLDEARARLSALGLRPGTLEVPAGGRPRGSIVAQEPAAGTRVALRSPVRLDVAGAETVTVADLRGLRRAEAERIVAALRLVAQFQDDPQAEAEPDVLVAQDPAPGTSVEVGTALRATVAAGIEVPDLRGHPLERARDVLRAAGLMVEEATVEAAGADAGTVLGQQPEAHARVRRGALVRVSYAEVHATGTSGSVPVAREARPSGWADVVPWLPTGIGVMLAAVAGYRYVRANAGRRLKPTVRTTSPSEPTTPDAVASPAAFRLQPTVDPGKPSLEVFDRRLIDFDVRMVIVTDQGTLSIDVEGRLVNDERRLYE